MQALPANLRSAAEDILTNPARIEMTEHLALLNAMLVESVNKWDAGASAMFPKLQAEWDTFTSEIKRGAKANQAILNKATVAIDRMLKDGVSDHLARIETRQIVQDIRRVSETERKRLVDAELMVSADQFMVKMQEVADLITREVTDPDTLVRLHRGFGAILGAYRIEAREKAE